MESKKIYSAMVGIMKDVEAITKDKKNTGQGYNFRGIDDCYNAMHDLFAKHEVFITTEIVNATRENVTTRNNANMMYSIIDYKFTFHAVDGSSVSSIIRGEACDMGDKASNKAASVALKYALMQTFLIPTEELKSLDPDAETHEIKNKSEFEKAKDYIARCPKEGLRQVKDKIYEKFEGEELETLKKILNARSLELGV